MKKILLPFLLFTGLSVVLSAQIGGQYTYQFLNLSPSARVSALGGHLISVVDDDVSLAFQNPALLNPAVHQQLAFNHSFYLDGASHGYAAYGHHSEKINTNFHAGIQYVNYGEFEQTNEFFQTEGTFKANEYALAIGASRTVYERINLGANLKIISSQLADYNSFGLAADLAATYQDTARNLVFTILFKNAGAQLSTYTENNRENLPFEIQFGVSKRLKYLPFRFSVIYTNAQRWNVLYDDPNAEDGIIFLGQEDTEPTAAADFFDNLFRHFVFNGELLLGAKDNFRLRVGYNHRLRRELSVDNFGSTAGFSFGAGIKINRFRIDYGRYNFHLGGGLNHLGISTNLQEFK